MTEEITTTPAGVKLIEDFVNTNELDEVDGEKLRDPGALAPACELRPRRASAARAGRPGRPRRPLSHTRRGIHGDG